MSRKKLSPELRFLADCFEGVTEDMPKTFLVVEKQDDGGCDYSIGCGVRTNLIEAESMEAVHELLKSLAFMSEEECHGYGGRTPASKETRDLWNKFHYILDDGERERSTIIVYEVGNMVAVPISMWKRERAAAKKAIADAAIEAEEREQLRRLQEKYRA